MDEILRGSRVKVTKSVWDDGADHHPPGWLAMVGEELVVREPGYAGNPLFVSHANVTDSCFRILPDEYQLTA